MVTLKTKDMSERKRRWKSCEYVSSQFCSARDDASGFSMMVVYSPVSSFCMELKIALPQHFTHRCLADVHWHEAHMLPEAQQRLCQAERDAEVVQPLGLALGELAEQRRQLGARLQLLDTVHAERLGLLRDLAVLRQAWQR